MYLHNGVGEKNSRAYGKEFLDLIHTFTTERAKERDREDAALLQNVDSE